jgi:hypothetical protein
MDETEYAVLGRQSLLEPRSASQALVKLAAMDQLARAGAPIPLDRFRADLLALLEHPFDTWEGSRVLSRARRLLNFIDEGPELDFESEQPDEIASPLYWPGPKDEFAALDVHDTEGSRDEWRARLEGPAPWKAAS